MPGTHDEQTQHRWSVMAEIDGFGNTTWDEVAEVQTTAQTKKVWNGGETTPDLLTAAAEHGTGSLTRNWWANRDMAVYKSLVGQVGQLFFLIHQKPTDPNLRATGEGAINMRVLLTGIRSPMAQAGAQTDENRLVLDYQVQSIY